ncbi:MAG: diadenylate cyclase CdaA [Ruminococcus sp.]|nr:diadenylate cyclase CdaA [Ruminococcus sp.]
MSFLLQLMNDILAVFRTIQFKDIVDIVAITFIIFSLFKLVKETRAEQLLKGVIILLAVYLLSSVFGLTMMSSLMRLLFEFSVLIIAIIFQPEIRKALERIGQTNLGRRYIKFFFKSGKTDEEVDAIRRSIVHASDAANIFSGSKTGALIVFERNIKLSDIADTGTILDSNPSVALFGNIFFNKAPLHDGATIIRDGRIYASGCILPLTSNKGVDINLGTRHRAALGLSEISDAAILVVSEETGNISLAVNGVLYRDYTRETLIAKLEDLLIYDNTRVYVKNSSKFSLKRKENKDGRK